MAQKQKFSAKQRAVAEMLADPTNMMTDTQIMEECNVPRSTFYRWLREDEEYIAYLNELIDKYTDAELSRVWKALLRRCISGDTQAIKLYFELKGKYKQNVNVSGSGIVQIIDDIPKGDDNA